MINGDLGVWGSHCWMRQKRNERRGGGRLFFSGREKKRRGVGGMQNDDVMTRTVMRWLNKRI